MDWPAVAELLEAGVEVVDQVFLGPEVLRTICFINDKIGFRSQKAA